jgi:hypothetical protein
MTTGSVVIGCRHCENETHDDTDKHGVVMQYKSNTITECTETLPNEVGGESCTECTDQYMTTGSILEKGSTQDVSGSLGTIQIAEGSPSFSDYKKGTGSLVPSGNLQPSGSVSSDTSTPSRVVPSPSNFKGMPTDEILCRYAAMQITADLDGRPIHFNKLDEGAKQFVRDYVKENKQLLEIEYLKARSQI